MDHAAGEMTLMGGLGESSVPPYVMITRSFSLSEKNKAVNAMQKSSLSGRITLNSDRTPYTRIPVVRMLGRVRVAGMMILLLYASLTLAIISQSDFFVHFFSFWFLWLYKSLATLQHHACLDSTPQAAIGGVGRT